MEKAHLDDRTTEVNELLIHYRVAGSGPPLLLLHALGESGLDWQWVIPTFVHTHRIYALDLPGSGKSAKPATDYTPAFFTRMVIGFLDALKIEQALVIGNSLGGLIALRLAFYRPERVRALVLVDSAGLGREVSLSLRTASLPVWGELAVAWHQTPIGAWQRVWERVVELFAWAPHVPAAWQWEQYWLAQCPGFLPATLAALRGTVDVFGQREVLLEQLPRLAMPTLVVWGEHDSVFPLSQAREAVARLSRGKLAVIPGAGHMPHIEQPEQFVDTVCPFLAEARSSAAACSQTSLEFLHT